MLHCVDWVGTIVIRVNSRKIWVDKNFHGLESRFFYCSIHSHQHIRTSFCIAPDLSPLGLPFNSQDHQLVFRQCNATVRIVPESGDNGRRWRSKPAPPQIVLYTLVDKLSISATYSCNYIFHSKISFIRYKYKLSHSISCRVLYTSSRTL